MGNEIRALRGMRFTLFVYSVMVWGWGYLTLVNIQGIPFVLVVLLPLLLALPLFLSTIRFSNRLRGLAGPKLFKNSRAVWLYVIGLVVTVGGYVLAVVLARALHHPEYIIPIATLIVGLHFLFIALAFDAKRTYSTVAVFCLTALLVPLTIPLRITIGLVATTHFAGSGWMVVTGIVGLLWLSLMAMYLLTIGGRSLREVRGANRQFAGAGQVG